MAIREDARVVRPVTTVVAGVAVTACAVVAGAAAAVPGWVLIGTGKWEFPWEYFWVLWLLLLGLAAAGIALVARRRAAWRITDAPTLRQIRAPTRLRADVDLTIMAR